MASVGRRCSAPTPPPRRTYVASLLWPSRLPSPANDNRARCDYAFIAAFAGLLLAAAGAWGVSALL